MHFYILFLTLTASNAQRQCDLEQYMPHNSIGDKIKINYDKKTHNWLIKCLNFHFF